MSNILCWISQDTNYFHSSLRNNITLFDESYTDEIILSTIDRLGLKQWFESSFESGLETIIGEEGRNLSPGEGQLIALIHAFIKDYKIFVLDEFTAKLDADVEQLILNAARTLLAGKTALIVSHEKELRTLYTSIYNVETGEYGYVK